MNASVSMNIIIPDLGQLEIQYSHHRGEVEFWIYKEDGEQNHGTIKVKTFIQFADMVIKMEDDYR